MFEDCLIESGPKMSSRLRNAIILSLVGWLAPVVLIMILGAFAVSGTMLGVLFPILQPIAGLISLASLVWFIVCMFRTRAGATKIVSFVVLSVFIGVLVLLPLVFTEALPTKQLMTMLTAPPPPPPPPPPAAAPVVVRKMQSELDNGELRTPTAIPKKIQMIKEDEGPPSTGGVMGGVPGGVPGGTMGGVLGSVMNVPTAIPKAATPQRVRVSQGVSQGLLIHKVTPQYPPLARQARIQGVVVLQAEIGKDGSITNLHVVSGHPMLTNAALEAVKEWRYKPYYLNGEPVEVETTINVNFTLSGE